MRTALTLSFLLAGVAGHAAASDIDVAAATDLAKATGCYSCHSAKEKIVGPAFATIAEKYKGDKDAVATLSQSIQMGSSGKYGRVPMPGHASLKAPDLKLLAAFVLSTKP